VVHRIRVHGLELAGPASQDEAEELTATIVAGALTVGGGSKLMSVEDALPFGQG
jgi:hypothetical protein